MQDNIIEKVKSQKIHLT